MEVFIRDEDKKLIRKYPNNVYRLKTINNKTKEFDTVECEIKSLDQHDAEVRNKVIDELFEWINENKNDYMCRANTQHISGKSFSPHMAGASITVYTDGFVDDLKQKLNEMKGGK